MPLTALRPARWSWRTLLPWTVGLLPLLGGMAVMRWQAERELHEQSQAAALQVLRQSELILEQLSRTARTLLPLAGQPCESASLPLRAEVTRNAFVRSTVLFDHDRVYCTSLLGGYDEAVDINDYTEGTLWLMDGNSVTPGHPLLVYRLGNAGRGVLVTVDGEHVLTFLRLSDPELPVQIRVGDHWIGAEGQVRTGTPPSAGKASVQMASTRFPLSVQAGLNEDHTMAYMLGHYPALFGLLVLLGLLAGSACRWQIRRATSPRAEIERALQANEFVPYLQPVVRRGDYKWSGVEVLMRWQHPKDGLVRPDLFIPYAEHSGQIVPMTRALMEHTATSLAPFAPLLDEHFHIAFNITADHCRDLSLLDDCARFLAQFPPGRIALTLELTERKLIEPSPTTLELFNKLHDMGVMIALDDFGTGQSSLNYLRQFRIDYLKIDQSFVAMIGGDALSLHILESIIELCGKLGLGIVAEGVETAEQRDYLDRHTVDYQQGYLFARPMPVADFLKSLAARPSAPTLSKASPPEIIPD
ncbi:cyclic diguanylate phosphodiesterase [Pseudomonas sp.]|uniref:cyclic diguanylate phosphodiesterase n=1 Tax=Pseudomonas sp. TaxID=306 RepID=UPI0028A8B62E|nr:cyclic diguanylate phosphodiesterase [Pseudomonas sp.]